jgi:protein TonB
MSENKKTTDSELLLQIVGYNSNAFEQLYDRYSATIYSLIKEIVTNPKQAEKILINVFSVFLKRIDYYSTNSNNVFTWLTLLARNISIDTLKRMKFVEDIPIYSDDYEIEFILPNLSQEISLINLDERELLSEKIKSYKNQLSEVQNLVLSLIYFEGLNEEEIAKRLNVTAAIVRQKTLAIMEALHAQYAGGKENATANKELLNLVKLESLGCLTADERMMFNQIRINDPDFLWKEYGEYQNLTALLATAIPSIEPATELNSELRTVFTKILQGNDVDYPIVASEIPIFEPARETIPEALLEKNITPLIKEEPAVKEEKDSGFHMRFRERDPKELSVLRKIDNIEEKPKPAPVFAKTESEIKFKSYQKATVNRSMNIVENKNSNVQIKETISAVINEEHKIQNKLLIPEPEKQNLQIVNDDPSIILEEPKPIEIKKEVVDKNHLIPNSSLNLKEIIRKDEKPVGKEVNPDEGRVENIDIKIKTNEPPKEFRSNIFVNRDDKAINNIPSKINNQNIESLSRLSEPPSQIQKTENEVLKEIIPVKPLVEKADIKIKTNEPPKEFKRSTVFVDKNLSSNSVKQIEPIVEKPEIKIKSTEPPKEIKKTFTEVLKENEEVIAKVSTSSPIIKKTEIKTNIPVKEVFKIDHAAKIVENVDSIKTKINVEDKKINNIPANQVSITKAEIKTEAKKVEADFERIKPAIDKSNLKIRETVFAENVKKSEVTKKETSNTAIEAKIENENTKPSNTISESINIDEIISKIEEEKPEPVKLSETESYEKEIVKLRKKLRRNILVSAALFAVLAAASVFVYFNFIQAPEKVFGTTTSGSEKINLAGQTNLVLNNNFATSEETENTVVENGTEALETPETKVTVPDKKVVIPPLPEITTKEESTLFASNIKDDLTSSNIMPTQTAAAKTETILPPKEIKKVEEEPAFFVAVEEMPELIGGIKGLQGKIVYPEIAKRVGVEGKVIVQAIVDENGKVVSVNTVKGIGSGCDEVAMDAVRNSKFVPGKQRGKNVKVQVTIPIVFKK